MIADLKPYAEYKESGLPWLGKVPGHWSVRRMKSAVINVIEQTCEMSSDEVYVALEHVESWTGKARPQSGSNLFTGQVKRFRQGDVLFGKLRPYLAKVTRISNDGVCAGEFFVLRPTDEAVSSAYLEHQLRAKHTIDVINGSTFGAKMPRADWQFCGNLQVPLPTPNEQAAIVRFLDWANGRLERAIRAKRKVIALLNEQKQAIIHRAVTRGLDPSVPLKPSGIPWLGDIPKHWEVKQLRRLVRYGTTITYGIVQAGPDLEGGIPYIRTSDMKGWVLSHSGYLRTSREIDSAYRRSKVEPGDLVVAIRATLGKGLLVPDYLAGANLTQGTARVAPSDALSSQFLFYAFNSSYCQESIRQIAKGTTFLEITLEALRQIPLAVPPLTEQRHLSAAISEQTQPLSALVGRTEREITLLLEYRTRLVADVVTGKLDVREAAARLPEAGEDQSDESEESDMSDESDRVDETDMGDALEPEGEP